MIRPVHSNDAETLLAIYNYYVLNTAVTFDIEPLTLNKFSKKIDSIVADYPFIVFEADSKILGFAYASKFRPKPAYNFTIESTVYVKHTQQGKQIGAKLYSKLLDLIKETNTHTVIGVLTIPNVASIKLHEKFGFKQVANLEEVGKKFGKWHSVGIWQLRLKK